MRASPFAYSSEPALASAVDWLTGTLLGSIAAGLCVLAVAVVGFLMLQGRLPIRRGAAVILGCFVLLGAPVIAGGFAGFWQGNRPAPAPLAVQETQRPVFVAPQDTDPYARDAGANLPETQENSAQ